jgi:hypothetical protein
MTCVRCGATNAIRCADPLLDEMSRVTAEIALCPACYEERSTGASLSPQRPPLSGPSPR